MKRRITPTLLTILAATFPPPSPALADAAADFEAAMVELDAEIERYGGAREREEEAIRELQELRLLLEARAQDPDAAVAELRELDAAADRARETACRLAEESSALRSVLYDRMETLEAIAREIEVVERPGERTSPAGSWRFEASPNDVHGVIELRVRGSLVEGEYRSSNGNHGSVRGTFSGGRLQLDRYDADLGPAGQLVGELDRENGRLVGQWTAQVLSTGEATSGGWVAYPVDGGEE